MQLKLCVEVGVLDPAGDAVGYGADEEEDWGVLDVCGGSVLFNGKGEARDMFRTLHQKSDNVQWHYATLGIVHIHPISHPAFRLAPNLILLSFSISLWN